VEVEAAEATLERQASVSRLLATSARCLVDVLGADGAAISRLVGELIVDVSHYSPEGRNLALGYGYLLSDYPLTKDVVELREPRVCSLLDADCDESEAALLRELDFDSLLMAPLERSGEAWGLVEVYAHGRRFSAQDAERAARVVARAGDVLARLAPPPPPPRR
jgi:hypothetical protein